MINVCICKFVRLILFSCFSLTGFGYKSDWCLVCPHYSSCKWNESRGGERLKIHEGNGKELEGKRFCGISEKAAFRLSLVPAAKFLSPLPAVPSYLQTCCNQCRVCTLEEILPWGAAALHAAFLASGRKKWHIMRDMTVPVCDLCVVIKVKWPLVLSQASYLGWGKHWQSVEGLG